ncbi:hypothetical protein EUGRSUZ_B03756 [Eucalyptus grandis]|uniref:Uncharacterized protein n=2 Tax=Eucalyptus grandis TaxID=71139 RepID=A0ACC3LX72_EUCGR|nr:hypothetical protein EUGRSUZ_B03756 [Eucalyptus grandis]
MAWVCCTHHVLCIPHLLSELWDSQSTILLRATGSERGKSNHEEVKTGEGDEIDCKLSEVRVQLPREPEAACNPTHGSRNQMVQIANCNRVHTYKLMPPLFIN